MLCVGAVMAVSNHIVTIREDGKLKEIGVQVIVDEVAPAKKLGPKAYRNKRGKARFANGAIVCKVL
jgi:hypothetical protein